MKLVYPDNSISSVGNNR